MKAKFFGQIDINDVQDCYDATFELNGEDTQIDVWFEVEAIDPEVIGTVDNFFTELPAF